MKNILLASAIIVSAGSAFAAEAVVTEAAPELVPGFVWTGGYVGLQAGYTWGESDTRNTNAAGPLGQASPDPDGGFAGIYAGYNHQFENNVVLGIDADINWSGAKSGFETVTTAAGVPLPPNQHSVELNAFGSIRARLGYSIDRFHPYFAAGAAVAKASFVYDHIVADAFIDDTLTGWTVGGGLEYAATDNLILRTEYRYADYGSGSANAFPMFPGEVQTYDLQTHDIRLGVAYKF